MNTRQFIRLVLSACCVHKGYEWDVVHQYDQAILRRALHKPLEPGKLLLSQPSVVAWATFFHAVHSTGRYRLFSAWIVNIIKRNKQNLSFFKRIVVGAVYSAPAIRFICVDTSIKVYIVISDNHPLGQARY